MPLLPNLPPSLLVGFPGGGGASAGGSRPSPPITGQQQHASSASSANHQQLLSSQQITGPNSLNNRDISGSSLNSEGTFNSQSGLGDKGQLHPLTPGQQEAASALA